MPTFGSKRKPSVYAYIRVSIDSSLHKPTLSIPIMPSFICLNLGRKGCPSVYAHIMVLIIVSQNMPSEYVYIRACKHASLFTPTSGFPKWLPLYTHIWISKDNPSVYGPVRVSNNASVYLPIMLPKMPLCICQNFCLWAKISLWGCYSIHTYIWVSKDNLFCMSIFRSQKRPSVYAHVRVSIYASIYIYICP